MAVVSMKQLLEAGVHFGHQTRRWNPKMAEYIFTERNGIYIIDLQKTVKKLEEAYAFVRELSENGGELLFVGTRGRITLHDTGRPSHEEMTLAMNRHLIQSLVSGQPLAIDIYDLATWCSVIPLSEESIRRGFAPVECLRFRPYTNLQK